MNERDLEKGLKDAFGKAEGTPPPFAETWASAEAKHKGSGVRLKAVACVAAAAVLAIAISFLPEQQAEVADDYLIAEALMNSTSWSAPSDALMPERLFDIYREVPFPDPSTISEEGSLL